MKKLAVIAGASGLVGSELLNLLLASDYARVEAWTRSPLAGPVGAPPELYLNRLVNFENLNAFEITDLADFSQVDFFCCLGTTIKKAGSQQAFEKVDFEYVYNFGKKAKSLSAAHFVLISALGANSKSLVFYNRIKGKAEEALKNLYLPCLVVLRPSLLLGHRKEFRLGELIAIKLAPLLEKILVGDLKKYQPVRAKQVAHKMKKACEDHSQGFYILENSVIL